MLGDQVISPELYQEALLLSHLARSVFGASCAAARARGVDIGDRPTAESCAVDPRFMEAFGDRDTMAQLGRLYRKIAADIGASDQANLRIEEMIPSTAAGHAFDLVGMIEGRSPQAKIVADRFQQPSFVDFLAVEGPVTPKSSKLPIAFGVLGVIAGGLAVGWALSKD
jgi:hypothetical protein